MTVRAGSASGGTISPTNIIIPTGGDIALYNTADQTTNYERGVIKWDTNAFVIGTEKGGTGSSRTLNFQVDGMSRWYITTAGHFLTTSSNGYDIGASGSLVRSLYYGTNLDGASGATFNLYNTADQTTNYERLRADWSGNLARLFTQFGGSGAIRGLRIGIATAAGDSSLTRYFEFTNSGAFNLDASQSGSGTTSVSIISGMSQTASTQTVLAVAPTINQSGTAGYILADFNATETATGSGTKLLQRWAVDGTAVGQLYNNGVFYAGFVIGANRLGLSSIVGGTADVELNRDAADTLALRRSTNAQTFRVYNTYTDGSNYERGFVSWITNAFWIGAEAAGTGTKRALNLSGSGIWVSPLSGSTSTAWFWSTAGHYLAQPDNTYDIGASGTNRPRNIYIGGSTVIGAFHTVGVSTVAALPAAAGAARAQIFVSDSSVAAAGNFGAIVVGGGANIVPVFCDGTNWRIG